MYAYLSTTSNCVFHWGKTTIGEKLRVSELFLGSEVVNLYLRSKFLSYSEVVPYYFYLWIISFEFKKVKGVGYHSVKLDMPNLNLESSNDLFYSPYNLLRNIDILYYILSYLKWSAVLLINAGTTWKNSLKGFQC